MPEHVSCIIWRRFSKAVKHALVSGDALYDTEGGQYPTPLMYQSPGTFRAIPRLSLGILKCAISGASPLCGYIGAFRKLKNPARVGTTYVCVSCVAMHVRMSSMPVVQSRRSRSESSSAHGGTLTSSCTSAPARVALSRRFPAKEQTRKSCFGVSRHEL